MKKLFHLSFIGVVLLTCCTMIILDGCREATENSVGPLPANSRSTLKKSTLEEKEVVKIAQTITKFMKREEIRKALFNELSNSSYDGSAIDANYFLSNLRSHISAEDEINALDNAIKKVEPDCFRIYFPFEDHRNKWKGEEELFIAGVNRSENDDRPIIAYNLDGKKMELSTKIAPTTPTLIICPGNLEKSKRLDNSAFGSPFYGDLLKSGILPALTNEVSEGNWFNCAISGLIVKKNYDDWWDSDLEIYIKYKYQLDGGLWSAWNDLYYDNDENIIVQPGHWKLGINRQICQFDKNFSIMIEIWDKDLDSPDDFVADAYYNYSVGTGGCYTSSDGSAHRCSFIPTSESRDLELHDGDLDYSSDADGIRLHWNSRY